MSKKHICQNCMTVIVGKGISTTGRVLVAHNEDDPGHVIVRHTVVPAMEHASGETIPAEKGLARIPQVSHTLRYYWAEYIEDKGGLSTADAFYNECGVVITSNSMGDTRENCEDPSNVEDGGIIYTVRRVLAERAHSAREGAMILIDLMEKWGYASAGRAYTIADKDEAFMFQLCRGHHYIGARVPDDAVVVMPNHYTFHTLSDCPEMFYSADIVDYAIERGWYVPKTGDRSDFDFAAAYQGEKTWKNPGNMYRQKHGSRIVLNRAWDLEKEGTPFCVYPTEKIGIDTLAAVMSTHYEGTEDDNERLGPGLSPHYFINTRRICTGTTLESNLWEFAEEARNMVVYSAFGRPCQVPYLPVHPLLGLPECLKVSEDPLVMMAMHCEEQPGVTAQTDCLTARLRTLCCAQEMQFHNAKDGIAPLLKDIFNCARLESVEAVSDPDKAAEMDERFIIKAVDSVEAWCRENLNTVEIRTVSGISVQNNADEVSVEFVSPVELKEETIRFGLEFTHILNAYALAVKGSLTLITENTYTVRFGIAPIMTVLPFPGRHEFWIGGQSLNNSSYAGRIIINVQ